jgi:four helix bundle protein
MKICRFEDIQAWQAARELYRVVYELTGESQFAKDFGLRHQARRAAVSIMANISEGFDCNSNQEFIQFLYYALRSASGLQSHFYVAHDQGYVMRSQFEEVYEEAGKEKRMIFGFIDYLRDHKKYSTMNLEPRTEPRS